MHSCYRSSLHLPNQNPKSDIQLAAAACPNAERSVVVDVPSASDSHFTPIQVRFRLAQIVSQDTFSPFRHGLPPHTRSVRSAATPSTDGLERWPLIPDTLDQIR
eukprot:3937532-Rhodomonas_salina.3